MATHASPEERRTQILTAAQFCFGKTGYHKTKMDDIVAAFFRAVSFKRDLMDD